MSRLPRLMKIFRWYNIYNGMIPLIMGYPINKLCCQWDKQPVDFRAQVPRSDGLIVDIVGTGGDGQEGNWGKST